MTTAIMNNSMNHRGSMDKLVQIGLKIGIHIIEMATGSMNMPMRRGIMSMTIMIPV